MDGKLERKRITEKINKKCEGKKGKKGRKQENKGNIIN